MHFLLLSMTYLIAFLNPAASLHNFAPQCGTCDSNDTEYDSSDQILKHTLSFQRLQSALIALGTCLHQLFIRRKVSQNTAQVVKEKVKQSRDFGDASLGHA